MELNLSDELWKWIADNEKSDPDKLRLKYAGNQLMLHAITQIDCRRRTARKLGQILSRAPRFIFPSTLSAEQCSGCATAAIHARIVRPCKTVLDMTCGLGVDALTLARDGCAVTACELNPTYALAARHNASLLQIDNFKVECADSAEYLSNCPDNSFDCIFVDPARRNASGKRVFDLSECTPDIIALMPRMLRVAPRIVMKVSPMLDVARLIATLPQISSLYSLGDNSDCRELVAVIQRGFVGTPQISSITVLNNSSAHQFGPMDFSPDRVGWNGEFTLPQIGDTLYELWPSVVKLLPFRHIGETFKVGKIGRHVHLFHSRDHIADFPGKAMTVIDIIDYDKKGQRIVREKYPAVDLSVRDCKISVDTLDKILKVKPSGNIRLFLCPRPGSRSMAMIIGCTV